MRHALIALCFLLAAAGASAREIRAYRPLVAPGMTYFYVDRTAKVGDVTEAIDVCDSMTVDIDIASSAILDLHRTTVNDRSSAEVAAAPLFNTYSADTGGPQAIAVESQQIRFRLTQAETSLFETVIGVRCVASSGGGGGGMIGDAFYNPMQSHLDMGGFDILDIDELKLGPKVDSPTLAGKISSLEHIDIYLDSDNDFGSLASLRIRDGAGNIVATFNESGSLQIGNPSIRGGPLTLFLHDVEIDGPITAADPGYNGLATLAIGADGTETPEVPGNRGALFLFNFIDEPDTAWSVIPPLDMLETWVWNPPPDNGDPGEVLKTMAGDGISTWEPDDDVPDANEVGNSQMQDDSILGPELGVVFTECFPLYAPTAGIADTDDIQSMWRAPAAITINEVWCETDVGLVVADLQIDDGTPADVMGSDLACDSSSEFDITGLVGAMAAGDRLDLAITSVPVASDRLTFCVNYTYN